MSRNVSEGAEKLLDVYYPVLDHGFVSLVDYMGSDDSVERAARVSYGKGTRKRSDTETLIRYLMRHDHSTPFESIELVFHMAMPIFVARQVVRHRTASINEASARYSLMPEATYIPEEYRIQSKTNKQGSSHAEVLVAGAHLTAQNYLELSYEKAWGAYNYMIGEGVARELARIVTPVGAYTEWYWKIDLRNLLHFLSLRTHSHAQIEVREFAYVIAGIVSEAFPIVFEAWRDYDLGAVKLTHPEIVLLSKQPEILGDPGLIDKIDSNKLTPREIGEFKSKVQYIAAQDMFSTLYNDPKFKLPSEGITPEEANLRLHGEEK